MTVPDPSTITVFQGSTFDEVVVYDRPPELPDDLTGYSVWAEIRKYAGGPLLARFSAVLDTTSKQLRLVLSPTQTAALATGAVYDVLFVGAKTITVKHGTLRLIPRVSQAPSPSARRRYGQLRYDHVTYRDLKSLKAGLI
jgi:hypothetical protein